MTTKILKVCKACHSIHVSIDALARWDVDTQEWMNSSLLDNCDCDDCGGETTIIEMPVEPLVQCANCNWAGPESKAPEAKDLHQRLTPGDTVPAGECPLCAALVYVAPPK